MATPLGQVTGELQDVREWVTYGAPTNLPGVSSTKAYTGTYSVRHGLTGSQRSFGLTFAAQSSLRAGYWFNHNGLYAQNYSRGYVWLLRTSDGNQVEISWKRAQNDLIMAVDGVCVALVAATALNFSELDLWMHVGLTYVAGTPGLLHLWVNGQVALSYDGHLPDNVIGCYTGGCLGSSTNAAVIAVGDSLTGGAFGWAAYAYVDDFYVDGDIVNVNEMPPPDRFLYSQASGAGASSQWTPTGAATNYECVDDAVPDDDTTYVKAEAADLVDLYATADITLPMDYGIVDVLPVALAKRMAAGPTLQMVASDGVSADAESDELTLGTSYGYVFASMPLAPDGGVWTEEKFNDAQFGVKSAGMYA